MQKKEYIEQMKTEVFEHITKNLECPSTRTYYPYKKRIAANYSFLKREKNNILNDKKNKDEYSLVKYFKELDSITNLINENERIYLKIQNMSNEELTQIVISTDKESKKIISKIKRVSKKDATTKEELTKKSNELKRLSAIAKLYEQRLTCLRKYIDTENKKIR